MSYKITEEQKDKVIEALKQYGTIIAAARAGGMDVSTVHNEMNRSPKFKEAVTKAREDGRSKVGDTALQVIMGMAFHKNDPDNPLDKVDNKCKLTAALALTNAFVPGFKGTTNIQGRVEHDITVHTAIPRPKYDITVQARELPDAPKQLPSADDRLNAQRLYHREYMRKHRATVKARAIHNTTVP